MKITQKNKSALQFCFSNPHLFDRAPEISGITREQAETMAARLKAAYGDNWFSFFLALKPTTLNAKLGK